jgi:hypothetical protein
VRVGVEAALRKHAPADVRKGTVSIEVAACSFYDQKGIQV